LTGKRTLRFVAAGTQLPYPLGVDLPDATAALKDVLDGMPGAVARPMTASRGSEPLVLIYKIMGKMFAILSLRGAPFVILKCDPFRAQLLRQTYEGVGHRSHLDRRYWISIELAADVSSDEINDLIGHSWDQVAATLTRKKRQELATLSE
jgi:predicted DNA-binding protein (MmcQ/YjbR family)